jgi:predicted site-specific integrase-resolvase
MYIKISIGRAATLLGVSKETLRRWERIGKIESERTPQGHRRYDQNKILGLVPKIPITEKRTIGYARVSSHDQKKDLKRQADLLESYCASHGWSYEIIQDLGSGLNYSKKGLKKLLREICSNAIDRLVLTHKDRLLRFGAEIVFSLCEEFGIEVVIMNATEAKSFEEDLASDVLEIITVFSARLYGARSRKNKDLLEKLKDAAEKL